MYIDEVYYEYVSLEDSIFCTDQEVHYTQADVSTDTMTQKEMRLPATMITKLTQENDGNDINLAELQHEMLRKRKGI